MSERARQFRIITGFVNLQHGKVIHVRDHFDCGASLQKHDATATVKGEMTYV